MHSTYLIDQDFRVKWDPRCGPEVIKPEDIESAANHLHRLSRRAIELNSQVRQVREFEAGILEAKYILAHRRKTT